MCLAPADRTRRSGLAGRNEAKVNFPGRDELLELLAAILPVGWLEAAGADDIDAVLAYRDAADRPAIVRALGQDGWVAPHWAPEYGGRGLDFDDARAAASLLDELEVPRQPRGSGLVLAAPAILEWSDEATKCRFLPSIADGTERWCQLFSEPGAGSDLASLAMTAERDGDEWVLNGQKVWTTMGHESEFAMTLVRTDPSLVKHAGITYFGVDMRSRGVEVRPLVNIARQVEFNEVFLTDVRVPDLHRISPLGKGWSATQTTLGAERHALSGTRKKRKASDEILGGKTIEDVIALARQLDLTGDPNVRQALAREWSRQRILGLTTQRAQQRRNPGPEGSITKIAKAAWNQSLQLVAMDLLGARATAWSESGRRGVDEPEPADFVTQMLRTRANSIEGGTSEIQRNIVGERVLGLPREPDPYRGQPWRNVPRS